jgi:hypothetical protein
MRMEKGQEVLVKDALGVERRKRIIGTVEANGAGPRVLACDPAEWDAAEAEGREPEPDPFPWPLSAVKAETHV